MSDTGDLTRWNRAGLRRFKYVDGNAATYLERLRAALADRFPDWDGERVQLTPEVVQREAADPLARRDRMLKQYHDERRDWAWEIARSFARACHVLTGHINAFANEGFVETATQWDLLRRLVEMLDYHPRPPASAGTVLVLSAKPSASGQVPSGLQVKHSPVNGAAPVVFETLSEIEVDEKLNEIRLAGWDRSPEPFEPLAALAASPWSKPENAKLSVGPPSLLIQEPSPSAKVAVSGLAYPAEIAEVDNQSGQVSVVASADARGLWLRGYSQLFVAPGKVRRPQLNGPGLIRLDHVHGLAAGDVVAWAESGSWRFNRVQASAGDRLLLPPSGGVPLGALFRAGVVPPVTNSALKPPGPEFRVALSLLAAAYFDAQGKLVPLARDAFVVGSADEEAGYFKLRADVKIDAAALYVVTTGMPPVGEVVSVGDATPGYLFDGSPAGLASGDWVMAEYSDGALTVRQATRIARIEENETSFRLQLKDAAEVFASTVEKDRLQDLIRRLRRVQGLLDEPVFRELRLKDLKSGALADRPTSVVEGIGQRHASPASYADKLVGAGIVSVRDLAQSTVKAVAGIPQVWLHELRARAEQLMRLSDDLEFPPALLETSLALLVASEGDQPAPFAAGVTLERLYGPFKYVLRPDGYQRNPTPVGDPPYILEAALAELPAAFKVGRHLLVEQEDGEGFRKPQQATITEIDTRTGSLCIKLDPPLPTGDGFTLGNTILRGNAVEAGHGETKPERLLGSGNATLLNQEFVMEVAGVSFIADSTMPAGVRADISVTVGQQIWQQVASLRDSGPADPHYTVRMTEQGFLRVGFGDGVNGRRLPTGVNNVRVRYRAGCGLSGNLAARSLERLVKPHALLASVRQPLPAVGGDDLETVASLRENAPASLLALERAVSLSDYASLATKSSVWQARAFARTATAGSRQVIEVVVVPAGGASLSSDELQPVIPDSFLDKRRDYLLAHAPPGVDVLVRPFEPVLMDVTVTVRIKSAQYDPATVVERVYTTLKEAFGLRRRRLGQALQRSEVYRVVEDVLGVENSDCVVTLTRVPGAVGVPAMSERPQRMVWQAGSGGRVIQSIVARPRQVIYLDSTLSQVLVTHAEYEL